WVRQLFTPARRTIRKAPRRFRPGVEGLEGRLVPTAYLRLETEGNDSASTATPLSGSDVKITGNIPAGTDVDYYAFTAQARDRVYAATMTAWSSSDYFESVLDLLGTDGSTVLESDVDNGSSGS